MVAKQVQRADVHTGLQNIIWEVLYKDDFQNHRKGCLNAQQESLESQSRLDKAESLYHHAVCGPMTPSASKH